MWEAALQAISFKLWPMNTWAPGRPQVSERFPNRCRDICASSHAAWEDNHDWGREQAASEEP